MTSCERIGSWLDGYHDGELGALRSWWVTRHLEGCEGCRSELAAVARLGDWMRDAASQAPAPDLWAGVAARLPLPEPRLEPVPARRRGPRWSPWLAAPAGLAAAAVLSVLFVRPAPAPDSQPAGVVRSLNSHGRPVMVLEGKKLEAKQSGGKPDSSPTIIWMMDEQHDPNPEEVADVTI
jgi:anti-sigma factor RsiW